MKKLSYTASIELIPLLEVPGVKQVSDRCTNVGLGGGIPEMKQVSDKYPDSGLREGYHG